MRAFINTARLEDGAESFDEAGSLAAWLRGRDLLPSGARATEGERDAAIAMAEQIPGGSKRVTLGADRGYDTADFVEQMREFRVTPHVAQNDTNRRSAIDARTSSQTGYAISQRKRKRIEEVFGWMKTVALQRKTRFRGPDKVGWMFTFAAAAYNLVRMRNLMAQPT